MASQEPRGEMDVTHVVAKHEKREQFLKRDRTKESVERDLKTMEHYFKRGVDPAAPIRQFVYLHQRRPAAIGIHSLLQHLKAALGAEEPAITKLRWSDASKKALECLMHEFISFITNEAVEVARARVSDANGDSMSSNGSPVELQPQDLLNAMQFLGFQDYLDVCTDLVAERKQEKERATKRRREEEQERTDRQAEVLKKARTSDDVDTLQEPASMEQEQQQDHNNETAPSANDGDDAANTATASAVTPDELIIKIV